MLVIISDLHLTDGSTCETINAGAFRQFVRTLSQQAEAACWRRKPGLREGVFELIDGVDVILLGDILDVLRSAHWLSTPCRPWDRPTRLLPEVSAITRRILAHNAEALACFRDLNGRLPLIASHSGETHHIPIRFHYMVGNHDWFYHLPGAGYDALRADIKAALGLNNADNRPFAHTLDEDPDIAALCARHRVQLQHGDVFDAVNYQKEQGRDASSLGDAIVIEVLNDFPERVRRALELPLTHPLYLACKEIDNIRPLLALPQYFAMASKKLATPSQQQKLHQLWQDGFGPLLDLRFVRDLDRPWQWDTVDALQAVFGLQQTLPLSTQQTLAQWLQRFERPESYATHALAEKNRQNLSADFVVYGHTHHAEMVPLAVHENAGVRQEQVYFNTGTWRRVHEKTKTQGSGFPFIHYHVMTYVTFYKDDERFGRRHEMWQGHLD